MKRLLTLLIGALSIFSSAYAKDYTWECSYKARKYLVRELGLSTSGDEKIAQAFLNHYNRASFKLDILVDNDGNVLFDGGIMSVNQAQDRIKALRTVGKQTIVLFTMSTYQRKSERRLEKLMKSVYQLIEYREKEGIDYDVYPVLCTNISLAQKVWALKKVPIPPSPTLPVAEKIEPEMSTDPQPTAKHTAKTIAQSKVNAQDEVAEIPTQNDTEVSTTPASGEYTVHVNSSLSVRATPSPKGKKIDTLTNGQRVQVIEISDGWAKILYMNRTCYVKADYLEKVEPSDGVKYNYNPGLMRTVYEALYKFMPYVILFLAILFLFTKENHMMTMSFLLGLAELLFAAGNSEISTGVVPWFCEPNDVGWIMTIVNFLLLCGVLIFQHSVYQGVMASYRLGCFTYVLSYPLMAAVGIALCSCLVNISFCWAPVVAIGLLWVVLKGKLGHDAIGTLRVSLWMSIALGGFLVFFLQTAGLLMLGGLAWILLRAISESKGTSSSGDGDSGSDHSSGTVEHSADGTPFVRHSDGSTTQLHDDGCGVMRDSKGKSWRANDDGSQARNW